VLSPLVTTGFLRVVTHPRFGGGPTPLPLATAFVDGVLARPNCRRAGTPLDLWERTTDLCRRTGATGKLAADAVHAAVAMAEGATWVTGDADFSRFEPHGLIWKHLIL
jgi:predicted nucleic acid-binding protein